MIVATNLQIDDKLIIKAQRLGRHRTKREAVTKALQEYIDRLEQEKIFLLFGSIEYDPDYDYKQQRSKS